MLLLGETGSGKTYLVKSLLRRMEAAMSPDKFKYVLFDLKQVEFSLDSPDGARSEYLYWDVIIDPDEGLDKLEELARLSSERVTLDNKDPMIFIYIEECDMAALDQERFDAAVIAINQNAKAANMKLVYSTSRPGADVVSEKLTKSFDLTLRGEQNYYFSVTENGTA